MSLSIVPLWSEPGFRSASFALTMLRAGPRLSGLERTAKLKSYESKLVWDSYQRLSQGDKSCLAQMLATPGSQQLTADQSAHSEFYNILHSFGMAELGSIDEKMATLGLKAWVLTANGRETLRVYLAQGYVKEDLAADEGKSVRRTALRFLLGYAPVQVAGGLLAYFLTRLGIDISVTASFNLAILTILSCTLGMWLALRMRHPRTGLALLWRLEQLQHVNQRRGCYVSAIMIAVFVFHMPLAIAHEMMLGALTYMALVKAFVSAAIVGLWAYFALPHEVERVFRKTRKRVDRAVHVENKQVIGKDGRCS